MTKLLVSVVMPTWNPTPAFLAEAVGSVLGQRGCELELLLVDDGSDPPVEELLRGAADPRLRLLRVEHGGPYRARNAALEHARGTFVRYADSDDLLEPNSTAQLLALGNGAVSYGATLVCDEEMRPGRTIASDVEGRAERDCLLGRFDVRLTSLLFPKEVVDAVGEWDEDFAVSGDWDYVLRALELAPVRGRPEVMSRYRRHRNSLTRQADVTMGEAARFRVVDRYFERHPELKGSALEREARARTLLDTAVALRRQGDRRAFWRRVARATTLAPRMTGGTLTRLVVGKAGRAMT